jgi:cell division inhibitor SepF
VSWLDQLFNHWSKTSDLKGESQAAYQSSFNEYANAISEYARTGTFPVEATKQRLAKHFEAKEVDSVIDQFLTPRQLHILEVIREYFDKNGFAPTMRELGTAVGLTSPAAVKYQLDILTEKGYLRAETSQKPEASAPVDSHEDEPEASTFNQPEASHIVSIDAKEYSDGRRVGEVYREGIPVILNCSQMQEVDRKRLIDFASGLVFASKGTIERVAQGVFLLTPPDVVVAPKEKSKSKAEVS